MSTGVRSFTVHADDLGDLSPFEGARLALSPARSASGDPGRAAMAAAGRVIRAALESPQLAGFTAEKGEALDFRARESELVPFLGSRTVRFEQLYRGVPLYDTAVFVELDGDNAFRSIQSSFGEPSGLDVLASLSPRAAAARALETLGAAEQPLDAPALYVWWDDRADQTQWRLIWLVSDVMAGPKHAAAHGHDHAGLPMLYNVLIDAHTGEVVSLVPRTANISQQGTDELDDTRRFEAQQHGTELALVDADRNVRTHTMDYCSLYDPLCIPPGDLIRSGNGAWPRDAVSAHANAAAVLDWFRTVLGRDGIDALGGPVISSVRCTEYGQSGVPSSWPNAAWFRGQMFYGQRQVDGRWRSYAAALDVVAHELAHGVTEQTADLEYRRQPGALNESFSDIFGVLIENHGNPTFSTWDWQLGEDLAGTGIPLRDLADPTRFGQPAHMSDYRALPDSDDHGGVHVNSGIHNHAMYRMAMSRAPDDTQLFTPDELAQLYYLVLTRSLGRRSTFRDALRAAVQWSKSLFRGPDRELKRAAVRAAYAAVGI